MRYRKIIIFTVLSFLLLCVLAFFGLRIREVEVEGGSYYSKPEIVRSAMADPYSYHTLYFLAKSRLRGVPCLPFVQEIEVEWKRFDRITLHVYDKSISGCVKYMGQYIYFDKDGIVLQSLSKPMEGVPVVTGIKFGKFIVSQAFEVEDPELFNIIMNLSQLISHYQVKTDQIRFDGRDVTLYSGKVQVHLGKRDFYDDALAALASVLDKTSRKDLGGTIEMERFEPGDKIILKQNTPVQKKGNSEQEGDSDILPEGDETGQLDDSTSQEGDETGQLDDSTSQEGDESGQLDDSASQEGGESEQ